MNRLAASSLALALGVAAGGALAQDGYGYSGYEQPYDDYAGAEAYEAGYEGDYPSAYAGGRNPPAYDMARVLSVDPIVEPGRDVQRRQCWREPAPSYANGYDPRYDDRRDPRHDPRYGDGREPRRTSGGGAVLGAIVGGLLGNTVGSGDGRQAATVAGAVIGGAIGHNIERNGDRRDPRYRDGYGYDDRAYRGVPAGGYGEVERCRLVTERVADERVSGYRVAYEYAGRTYQTVTDYHPGSELRVRVDVTPEG